MTRSLAISKNILTMAVVQQRFGLVPSDVFFPLIPRCNQLHNIFQILKRIRQIMPQRKN